MSIRLESEGENARKNVRMVICNDALSTQVRPSMMSVYIQIVKTIQQTSGADSNQCALDELITDSPSHGMPIFDVFRKSTPKDSR